MFAHSMQSQLAMRNQQRELQEVVAAYEERLRQAEATREAEVSAVRAKAQEALRALREQHEAALARALREIEAERRQVAAEQRRVSDAHSIIDELREERTRRSSSDGGAASARVERELHAARAEVTELRVEVDVLNHRLESREALFRQERARRETEEGARDAIVVKSQGAWKDRVQELEEKLREAWREQERLQEELARSGAPGAVAEAPWRGDPGPASTWGGAGVGGSTPAFGVDPPMERGAPPASAPAVGAAWGGDAAWGTFQQQSSFDHRGGFDHQGSFDQQAPGFDHQGSFESGDGATARRRSKSARRREREAAEAAATAGGFGGGAPGFGAAAAPDASPEKMQVLIAMGFSEEASRRALQETGGDVDAALAKLLDGAVPGGGAAEPQGFGSFGSIGGFGGAPPPSGAADDGRRRHERGHSRHHSSSRRGQPGGEAAPPAADPAVVQQLMAVGFSERQAQDALARTGGDPEAALNMLLS